MAGVSAGRKRPCTKTCSRIRKNRAGTLAFVECGADAPLSEGLRGAISSQATPKPTDTRTAFPKRTFCACNSPRKSQDAFPTTHAKCHYPTSPHAPFRAIHRPHLDVAENHPTPLDSPLNISPSPSGKKAVKAFKKSTFVTTLHRPKPAYPHPALDGGQIAGKLTVP
jgi:hypothetical protein